MSNDPSIFGNGNPPTPANPDGGTPPAPPAPADFTQYLSGIVDETGRQKYGDVPTALNALQHSQAYIAQLKAELEAERAKAAQAVTMEQVLEAIKPQQAPTPATDPTATPAGLTAEEVLRLLEQREAAKVQKANTEVVANRFASVHGEKAAEVFYGKAAELGMSRETINQLAATAPEAVFKMFGMDKGTPVPPPAPNGINTAGLQTPAPPQIKPAMGYVTETQLLDSWRAVKESVNLKLGITK